MAAVASAAGGYRFDDRNIDWQPLADFEYLTARILAVDETNNIADFLIKFDPEKMIFLHRHLAQTNTIVLDGEHVIYEPGTKEVREVRPVGCYTASAPGDAHHEGGGAKGCILHYTVRGKTDALFDVLDDDGNVQGTLRTADFKVALDQQNQAT